MSLYHQDVFKSKSKKVYQQTDLCDFPQALSISNKQLPLSVEGLSPILGNWQKYKSYRTSLGSSHQSAGNKQDLA